MDGLTTSDWDYETSKDRTLTFLFSFSRGEIYLKNEILQQRMIIPYSCMGASESKGGSFAYSFSNLEYISSGSFMTVDGHLLSATDFPCWGTAFSVGGGVAFGYSATIWTFGISPVFAILKSQGASIVMGAGGGFGALEVKFEAPRIEAWYPPTVDDTPPSLDNMIDYNLGPPLKL
jgi:hypothetical protein